MECSIARSSEFNLGYLTSLAVQSLAQHVSSMSLSPDNIFEVIKLKKLSPALKLQFCNSYCLKVKYLTANTHCKT